jgi:exodeoxyribonuclease V alpha subunit
MSPEEELRSLGFSPAQADWMRRRYGGNAPALVREDPYRIAREVPGVGFLTADAIALRLGLPEDSPIRIRAGITHCLRMRAEDGDVCLPFHRLVQEAQALLQTDRRVVAAILGELGAAGLAAIEDPPGGIDRDRSVYLPEYRAAEAGAAECLIRLTGKSGLPRPFDVEGGIARTGADLGLSLSPGQTEALRAALSGRLTVVTGGPGTGKTTVLRALLSVCGRAGIRVLLAAPTGRAARRMRDATGMEARTIHRLLEYAPGGGGFRKNQSDPLDCALLVVDEASMVDTLLMHHLIRALPRDCALLLVGDADQLPSVGAGQVLRDIIDSGIAVTVELTEAFRQARESDIVVNAHRILQGLPPEGERSRGEGDFLFVEQDSPAMAVERIVELVRDLIPRRLSVDPLDGIQVLAPMHKGEAGSAGLNRALQAALNPDGAALAPPELQLGSLWRALRVGDKVMQRRNNYDKGVFNGDVGKVVGARSDDESVVVSFEGEEITYGLDEVGQLSLAYALSVHKAQGSEYPAVVLSLLGEHAAMLQRNLLYTAITRARRFAVIVGSRAALKTAVKRADSRTRFTGLAERLKASGASR